MYCSDPHLSEHVVNGDWIYGCSTKCFVQKLLSDCEIYVFCSVLKLMNVLKDNDFIEGLNSDKIIDRINLTRQIQQFFSDEKDTFGNFFLNS